MSIALAAHVSESTGSLEDYRIEELYAREGGVYDWNQMPHIRSGNEVSINEVTVLDSFFYAAMQRMLTFQDERPMFPDFWPILKSKGSNEKVEYVIVRPCVEHNMLGVILGRGGGEDLGNTLWGQTELSCYDDSFHGVWGMWVFLDSPFFIWSNAPFYRSYKYHSRALVINPKNLIRLWDIAYDGYNGGKDDRAVDWAAEAPGNDRPFNQSVSDMSVPYNGPSLMVMKFNVNTTSREYKRNWPRSVFFLMLALWVFAWHACCSPIQFHDRLEIDPPKMGIDPESLYAVADSSWRVFNQADYREQYRAYLARMPDFSYFHQTRKLPGFGSVDAESVQNALAFQGSMRIIKPGVGVLQEIHGCLQHLLNWESILFLSCTCKYQYIPSFW
jgi:hypothetical protein